MRISYDTDMDASELRKRLPSLESAVRSLTTVEVTRFVEVVRQEASADHVWPPDQRFWFDGTNGIKLSADVTKVLRELWTAMNAALVYAVTGEEVDASIDRPGLLARLDRLFPRSQQIEGRAATVLERAIGGDVWLGTIGIWNAMCAALLSDRLEPSLREDLKVSWRKVRLDEPLGAGPEASGLRSPETSVGASAARC